METNNIDFAEQIGQLVELQAITGENFVLKEDRKKIQSSFQEIEFQISSLKQEKKTLSLTSQSLEEEKQTTQKSIDTLIQEIQEIKEKERQVKTQQEYVKLDTERSLKRDRIRELEEEQKKLNEENLQVLDSIHEKEEELERLKQFLKTKKEKQLERLHHIEEKLKKSEALRSKIAPKIDPAILLSFDRIVQNKKGIGIVPIMDGICEGCNIAVTPQEISLLRRKTQILQCINCARIMYLPQRASIF